MNNQIIKLTGLTLLSLVMAGCNVSADFDDPVEDISHSSGNADLTTFVTIGDSLTAGYADGALYLHGQNNSYPAILAQQFAKVGGGSFAQPLVSDNLGGLLFNSVADTENFGNRRVLDASTKTSGPIAGNPTTEVIGSGLNGNTYNNMGVPGAKSFHLISAPNYGDWTGLAGKTANPYFVRFSSDPTTTIIADAAAQQPSFYVMWIGNNDVLAYALSGGTGAVSGVDSDDITPVATFNATYTGLVGAFTAANPATQGLLVNIPDVSTIPYFTTVPYNAVPLDQATADALNAGFVAYNGGVATLLAGDPAEVAKRTITFSAGQNGVLILDEDLTDLTGSGLPSMRQATADDLLILTTSLKINTVAPSTKLWGITEPLEDAYVLIPSEIQAIETARVAFNTTIKNAAEGDVNLTFFDVAAVMLELSTTGIDYGTGFVDATYATGGAFSLDGVHPTARGYAVISNRMIDTINGALNATIPRVDPGAYSTIFLK
ncbi:MAG: hypothetical protein L3J28_05045 [Candidatus Polarisedimenticolaceae bacterium]|nr:hypothetical protein [Candidatus Polarisedimenticolaceae bacterium]